MNKSIKINTIFSVIKMGSSMLMPLVTFPYISRILQPANVGKINFSEAFIGYFALIAALGISTYGIRECAAVRNDKEKLNKIASEIFSINVITTLITYGLLFFIILLSHDKLESYRTLIIIQSTTILFTTLGADWVNSAMEDFGYITIRTLFFQCATLVLIFLFIKTKDDYVKYAFITVFASVGANFINIFYRRKFCKIKFTLDVELKKHLEPILWLFAMSAVQLIFSTVDVTMLGMMQGDFQVGIYSTAHKVTKIISQILSAVGAVVIPQLTIAFCNNDFSKANRLLEKILSFNFTIGLPCVVGVFVMAEDIILVVGGVEYSSAAIILRILSISVLFSLVGGNFLGNVILIPMKKEKYYMFVCSLTAIINVILNAILIPNYGAIGASISTAVNGFVICFLLALNIDRRIKIDYITKVIKGPLIGCIFVSLSCIVCDFIQNDVLRICIKLFCSVILYFVVQIITKNDLVVNTLDSVLKKIKRSK